ncbi:poly(R)-hydroxyalkanoic acid synthase subunit PhaE [Ruegeria lacuscaerulensis]|uniref:poly(R)-hydroxyalkanoic acid synthase subunit PhaE n=1 Tax=Ruegeria lacuscaerulensis TaxID=55218 RepID=UPI00147ECFFF|nr:poly(R)-hydroxyalkanoic acid synthase subunit PhaE [Ruegeria lacuscaerulensis]
MADDPFSVNPYFNSWLKFQNQLLKSQEPFWKHMAAATATKPAGEQLAAAEELWDEARKQSRDWMKNLHDRFQASAAGQDGISQEVLQRMMDPSQFLYAGSDEVNKTIQKLVEGPEFSDIGTLERQGLKATQEWIALREASADYRMVTGSAWTRAFEKFSEEMLGNTDLWKQGPGAVLNQWLSVANDELIATQRTQRFLDAQRKLLRAGINYRLRERDLIEEWCETHSIPTRTEVDDLHKTVYQLRHEVRSLKKQLADEKTKKRSNRPAPASKATQE